MIRLLNNDDFKTLVPLYVKMFEEIFPDMSSYHAVESLMESIRFKECVRIIGAERDGELVGFAVGNQINDDVYYFSALYLAVKNTSLTQELIEYALNIAKNMGYSKWVVDTRNSNIESIMKKYDGQQVFVRLEGAL